MLPTQARLPKVRFLLAGAGGRGKTKEQDDPRLAKVAGSGLGGSSPRLEKPPPGFPGGAGEGVTARGEGIYGVLQGSLDQAIGEALPCTTWDENTPGRPPSDLLEGLQRAGPEDTLPSKDDRELSLPIDGSPAGGGNRRASGDVTRPGKDTAEVSRKEIGAGRALYGGFVPLRHAPAASLYEGGEAEGDGSGVGGNGLQSLYGAGPAKTSGGGSLDDARMRQYAHEATARAQRLSAEKRNARVTRAKRHG